MTEGVPLININHLPDKSKFEIENVRGVARDSSRICSITVLSLLTNCKHFIIFKKKFKKVEEFPEENRYYYIEHFLKWAKFCLFEKEYIIPKGEFL